MTVFAGAGFFAGDGFFAGADCFAGDGFFAGADCFAGNGAFAGFAELLGAFFATVFFGADFACVFAFNFFFEPAMVAISDPGSLADPRDDWDEKRHLPAILRRVDARTEETELGERRFGAEAAGRALP